MSIVNKPNMNYGVWAEGGNIEIPSSEKVEEGWVVERPLNEHMNWIQNRQDKMLQYINQRGIPEWDIRTEYPKNAFVSRNGKLYQARSQNLDADPTANPEIWTIAFVGSEEFADFSSDLNNIKNTNGYLTHYVQKSNPVMTSGAMAPSYNSPNNMTGVVFVDDVAKIRKGLSVVAEFSGGTNPKDVVTHEQLALAIQNYKVGDIYITTASGDPKDRLGYGTWQRFAEGRTLVGYSSNVSSEIPDWVKVPETEFGEYEHTLTVEEIPSHTHEVAQKRGNIDLDNGGRDSGTQNSLAPSSSVGGDMPHNNVQPSIVVYFWKRTA